MNQSAIDTTHLPLAYRSDPLVNIRKKCCVCAHGDSCAVGPGARPIYTTEIIYRVHSGNSYCMYNYHCSLKAELSMKDLTRRGGGAENLALRMPHAAKPIFSREHTLPREHELAFR